MQRMCLCACVGGWVCVCVLVTLLIFSLLLGPFQCQSDVCYICCVRRKGVNVDAADLLTLSRMRLNVSD